KPYSKTPTSLPFHKDDKAMYKALLIWNRVVSWTGIFKKCIIERDPKSTSELLMDLYRFFETKISFSTAHPQAYGLAERMIQNLEYMVTRLFEHISWSSEVVMASPMIGLFSFLDWNLHIRHILIPLLIQLLLIWEKDGSVFEIHLIDATFKRTLGIGTRHAIRFMEDSFGYAKDKWDKSHATPDFKVGYLILHMENAFELELSEEISNMHPTFPVILIKTYKSGDAEQFPLRNKDPQNIPPV
ncbi:hypothetical protein O181_004307, partial [Austropuccinia psidii MF-1]|nr:hypothetical protein [Austropuccinia psidii MF-1]